MNQAEIIPILYDMAITIGGQVSLAPLLTKTLQRLLYHTSFPAGFICLDLPSGEAAGEVIQIRLDAAVGDYRLVKLVGEVMPMPRQLLIGLAARQDHGEALLSLLPATPERYHAFLRLPIGELGVVVLLAPEMPQTGLPLTFMFDPIMAHLAKAILLCRHHDQHTNQLLADRQLEKSRADFLALHDSLTLLPNRGLLLDRIEQAMAIGSHNGQHGALLTLNIDHFKQLNDIYGYEICDRMLVETARRLETCVRHGDTVARFDGDEFVLLLWPLPAALAEAALQAEQIALKAQEQLNQAFSLDQHEFQASFSIGISLFQGQLDSLENVLQNAESSVLQAKKAGRNLIRFFNPEMQAVIMERLTLEADLLHGLMRGEFEVYYQPQTDDTRRVTGAEVLLRWKHRKRGMISPLVFIPLAEETGTIVEIGDWVLESACAQLALWQSQAAFSRLQLAVNVSAVQFHRGDFLSKLTELLRRYPTSTSRLKLELTESVMLKDVEAVIEKIQVLKSLGLQFSIDDFGTGYSSLAYLKRLPLDQLKIDQSFVRDIASDPSAAVIVQTIVGMAHNLGLEVIAEGVESEEQLALLAEYGCHAYQGYIFGKPLPLGEFENRLRQDQAVAVL